MTNRREFLRRSGAFAMGGLMLSKSSFASPTLMNPLPEPGIQLFTFFNVIDDDVEGTLKKVAALGYKNIESAFSKKGGYYGMKPTEFSAFLKSLGMSWKSHHVLGAPFKMPAGAKMPTGPDGKPITIPPMRNLTDNNQELIDEAAAGGIEYLVCASIPVGSMVETKASLAVLNKTAEAAKKAGIQFAYHNHDQEFKAVDGIVPYELFLSETDKDALKFELDIAWAVKGGADPVKLFERYPGRFPLWHTKDLDKEHKTILPVGEGTVDYKKYFAARDTAGLKYYFVEHDMPADPFASITSSLKYIKTIQ